MFRGPIGKQKHGQAPVPPWQIANHFPSPSNVSAIEFSRNEADDSGTAHTHCRGDGGPTPELLHLSDAIEHNRMQSPPGYVPSASHTNEESIRKPSGGIASSRRCQHVVNDDNILRTDRASTLSARNGDVLVLVSSTTLARGPDTRRRERESAFPSTRPTGPRQYYPLPRQPRGNRRHECSKNTWFCLDTWGKACQACIRHACLNSEHVQLATGSRFLPGIVTCRAVFVKFARVCWSSSGKGCLFQHELYKPGRV